MEEQTLPQGLHMMQYYIFMEIPQHCAYTQDIASFLPQTTFEYCPNKLFDYFYAFGYPKMKLDSGITYLTETKDKNIRFCCKGII